MGYSSLKKDTTWKSAKAIEEWKRNSKGKNAEEKEEKNCISN
jgi:heme-degrading monooxygenase HmoA